MNHRLALTLGVLTAATASAVAQEPSLQDVLSRTATYVADFEKQLAGIVAEESYVQQVQNSSSSRTLSREGIVARRDLRSDFLLVKAPNTERFVEFRDVFEVDGSDVRDRRERLTRLFLEPTPNADLLHQVIEESARYNIGNIPRNVNTPMLPLLFLQDSHQRRFSFKRQKEGGPSLASLTLASKGGLATFRVSTEAWIIEFRERRNNTVIRTNDGRDFPAKGRFWIDPDSGAVLMSELVMEGGDIKAVINVNYQSEPLLGFRVPIEMREQYRVRSERIEGVATYGRFRQFKVHTEETIGSPGKTLKPPG